jgi:uncharacterized membrane protein YccC
LLLALTGFVSQGIAQLLHFHNAYWIPMTALIIMKPDLLLTNARSIARLGGTFVGASLATLVAMTLRPDGIWLSVLIVLSMYLAYALQNVNYALYAVPLTSYRLYLSLRPHAGGQYGGRSCAGDGYRRSDCHADPCPVCA